MQRIQRRYTSPTRHWLAILLFVGLLLSSLPGSLQAKETARASSQEDAVPILLGEYVQQPAQAEAVYTYAVSMPEEGNYQISPDDDEAAQDFQAAIFDSQGESVYEGPLAMEPLALNAGNYTIEVTALEDSFLSFFVLGAIGGMSESEDAAGTLYPGSIYSERDVNEPRYATIEIPDAGYPQEVLLFFASDEDKTFYLSVSGESVSHYVSSDDVEMVRFYSDGGSVTFSADPVEQDSAFTAIVFLAGVPVQLEVGGEIEATLDSDADTQLFLIQLDDAYDDVTVTLTPEAGSEAILSMSIEDRYADSNFYVYSDAQEDGSLTASTGPLLPGSYYVVVTSYDGIETNYTLTTEGVPGAPVLPLSLDETTTGTLEEGAVQYYQIEKVDAATFLRVTLTSDAVGSDLDLHIGTTQPLEQWSSTATGSNEEVILIAPRDEAYYVKLSSYSGSGDYELRAEVIPGVGLIETNRVIAESVGSDGFIVFGFEITQPGQFLSVLLASDTAPDLDLSVVHFGADGHPIHDLSSISDGSSEIVSQVAAKTGIYEARVRAYGAGGDFALLVRVEDPASLLGNVQQSVQSEPTVLLTDDFSDPDSGWAIDEEGAFGYVGDAYQMTVDPGAYRWVMNDEETYTDVSLEMDLSVISGDPDAYAGLICRATPEGYYYVDISPAGDYTIGQLVDEDVNILSGWADSDAILTAEGAVNRLRLDCIGDTLTAYANGELLDSVSIGATAEIAAGGYGFEAGNTEAATQPATVRFDNLVLSKP